MHSALYEGKVRHRRLSPVPHEFDYTMFMVYFDLAEVETVFERRWLWSTSRRAVARYRREDHLGDPALPLDQCVRDLVQEKTGRRPAGSIRLLTHLAYYGWCFNPVSFYYCFDRAGVLEAVVAEVSNTPWLERHCYVLDKRASLTAGEALSWRAPKLMHVSPFMKMEQEYVWALRAPDARLTVHMENLERGQRIFDATMTMSRVEITGRSLASALLRWPFMTLFVVGGIHWQALKLWLKGVPVIDHPNKRAAEAS